MSMIFKQERIGYLNRPFIIYKFATMDSNGNSNRWQMLLRQTGLDELPQIWNMLKGDIVLVGPRPLIPREHNKFRGFILPVKPGLTGWWQIHGRKQALIHELDLWYIAHQCLWLDIYICWKTIPLVLLRKHG